MSRPILSIVILSYNTKDPLKNCIDSLWKVKDEVDFDLIVVDNASNDGSAEIVKNDYSWVKLIQNKKNFGYSAGNNSARKLCRGMYVLFLNSDTVVHRNTLKETVSYLEKKHKVGAMTCKIFLEDGTLDKDARRSFPTPWVALSHLLLKIDRVFSQI